MKKIISIFLILLVAPFIYAQETTDEPGEDLGSPGITPDSFLWGLDKAIDQLSLLLATSPSAKAFRGLEIAHERLLEVKQMIEENKLEVAEKAKNEHSNELLRVKERIKEIKETDPEAQIRKEIEIEEKIKKHEDNVNKVNARLRVKIKIEGDLTEQQQVLIDSILESLKDQAGDVRIDIKIKKGETIIKIKQKTGKTDKEIREEFRLEKEEKTKVKIKTFENNSRVKVEVEFALESLDTEEIINELLNRLSFTEEDIQGIIEIEQEEFGLKEKLKTKIEIEEGLAEVEFEIKFVLDTVDEAAIIDEILAKLEGLNVQDIEDFLELKIKEEVEEEEELEIEVEIEKGIAEIEIEFAGEEFEFVVESEDREVIISEIIARTGLTREQIESVIKFEEEEDEEESEEDDDSEDEDDNDSEEEDNDNNG